MDEVPFAFCESVCKTMGIAGDGVVRKKHLNSCYTDVKVHASEEVEAVPKKHVRSVWINFWDAKKESVAESMKIVRRFPYSSYSFILRSPSINEAWVDFAFSLRRLDNVIIAKKLNDEALRLFQKLVTGRKLSPLIMFAEACEGGNMEVLKALLCQDQFTELRILYKIKENTRQMC
uniref:ANK_REP_REGION domain-containing protein n=1 Tax=Steinernema glaseri TaxID=37863 RepID=A0A1I8AIX2_9BILA